MDSLVSKRSLKRVTERNPSRSSFPWSQSWELYTPLLIPVFQELIRNREPLRNGVQRKKMQHIGSLKVERPLTGMQPVSFRKLKNVTKSVDVIKRKMKCVFLEVFWTAITQLPKLENIDFSIRAQSQGSPEHVSWLSHSCVKTHLGHKVLFHEKRCQGIGFYGFWLL